MITIQEFQQQHANSIGINGILANITNVITCEQGMVIELNFINRLGMIDKSKLKLDYHNPNNCVRRDQRGNLHDFYTQNNTSYVFYNSRISAETLVLLGTYFLNGMVPFDNLQGYCADCLDGSGTKKQRDITGLPFNIHPSNLELVTREENLRRGMHF
jgi:hypothetical protein